MLGIVAHLCCGAGRKFLLCSEVSVTLLCQMMVCRNLFETVLTSVVDAFLEILQNMLMGRQTYFKPPSNLLQTFFKPPSYLLQTSFKPPSNLLQNSFKPPSNLLQTSFKPPSNLLQTSSKPFSKFSKLF